MNMKKHDEQQQLIYWCVYFLYRCDFRTAKIGGAKELTDRQRRSLYLGQLAEFRRRYGNNGNRNNQSELLLCKNARGELMGVAAMEVEPIPKFSLNSRTTIMRAAPLMSNVAVSRKFRRRGIAEELVKQVELYARNQWGYQEMYLYVEERNRPAIRLYQKLGYRTFWVDPTATTLVPTQMGGMQNAPTTIVCMRKQLGRGVFGRLFS
jgi:GNAT superfamily N-acetyltransferase